jgi:hypothetical protein
MKIPNAAQEQLSTFNRRILIVSTVAACLLITVACSKKTEHQLAIASPMPAPKLQTAALVSPAVEHASASQRQSLRAEEKNPATSQTDRATSKMLGFTSRDFGVSFSYPRQYAFLNAKGIANDEDRMPVPDEGGRQITLARVEIPRGYYPDTDFEAGYFLLSLNPKLDEKQCRQWLKSTATPNPSSTTIDGTEFQYNESHTGAHGHASLVRQYVTFANNTCYEVELGLRTTNEDGMLREVDHQKVLGRLNAILDTVRILPTADTVAPRLQEPSAASTSATVSQNQ